MRRLKVVMGIEEKAVIANAKKIAEEEKEIDMINYDILERVLQDLMSKKEGVIDSLDLSYSPENYSFTLEEYNLLFRSLENYVGGVCESFEKDQQHSQTEGRFKPEYEHTNEYFPDARISFEYNGYKFIWRLLIGQGSARMLFDGKKESKNWPSKKFPLKFDENKKVIIKEAEGDFKCLRG